MMLTSFVFLLPSLVCLFSAATLFFRRKKNSRSQNIWMIFMLLTSVTTYVWGCYYSGEVDNFSLYYKLDVIDATFGLTIFPFIRLYFKSLTDESPLKWQKEYLWFLPALLIGGSSAIIYGYMGDEQATVYMRAVLLNYRDLSGFTAPIYKIHILINGIFYYAIWFIQLFMVMRYTIACLINYRRRLSDYFSNPEGKSLENIKAMLITLLVLLLVFLLGAVEETLFSQRYPLLTYLLLSTIAGLLYYLNYLVILVPYTAENLAAELLQSDKEAEEQRYTGTTDTGGNKLNPVSGIGKHKREEVITQINFLLDEEKLFLQKDLRLNDLVRLTQVNRSYVSLLINEEYRCTFLELINRKRIAYAKELSLANPRMSHAHIAEKSGFVHPSAFSRVFKQQEGMTFKEWHREKVG